MASLVHFDAGAAVLVVVRADNRYDVSDGTLFLPEGTRLIGVWSQEQPGDGMAYAVIVGNDVTWHFPIESVALSPLAEHLQPWQEQERIAFESVALAQEEERRDHPVEAQRLYARALIELEASGKTAGELADVRQKRAFLLREVGEIQEAIIEFERLARAYESLAFTPGYGVVDRDYVELAAQALNALGNTILHHADSSSEQMQQKLRQVDRRLLEFMQYIARRYVTKVEILLTCAEISHTLGDTREALRLLEQADALYLRQHLDSAYVSGGVTLHLTRLKQTFGVAGRKGKSRILAAGRSGKGRRA
jgi:tetratricopeptide (TPR) repeat protein